MAEGGGDMPPPMMVMVAMEEMIAALALSQHGEQKGQFLNEMIAKARNGNVEKLQKALFTLHAGLHLEEASVAEVMEVKDLIPVLIRGLKSNKVPVQQDATRVIREIMEKGAPAQREKVVVGEGAAIYPILLKMLDNPKEKVWQPALNALVWIFEKEGNRAQFRDPAIILAITKLAQRTNDTAQLFNVVKVLWSFCQRDNDGDSPLSLDSVRKLVALFGILYRKTKDDQITAYVTQAVVCLLKVEGCEGVIVSGGILPWVMGHLSHSSSIIRYAVMVILTGVARGGAQQMIEFLKAVKGVEEMKRFYMFVWDSNVVDPETRLRATDMKEALRQFFCTFVSAINDEDAVLKPRLINSILDSGVVFSLVKCLDEKEIPEPFPTLAVGILAKILIKMSDIEMDSQRLGQLVEAGAVPLLVELVNSSRKPIRRMAVFCLGQGNLIKTGSKVRDEVIRLGGLDKLLELLKGDSDDGEDVIGTLRILNCFDDLLATKPSVGLDKYEKLPDSLKKFLDLELLCKFRNEMEDDHAAKVLVRVFQCVRHLADYGKNGQDLLEKSSGLLENMMQMLQYDHPEVQRIMFETLMELCEVDKEYVVILIRNGIFDHVEHLVGDSQTGEFLSGYHVFFNYLAEGLSPGQLRVIWHILETEPSALKEMHRALKGTEDPVATFKAKIDEVLSRQVGVELNVA